jgi:hypothetical protein
MTQLILIAALSMIFALGYALRVDQARKRITRFLFAFAGTVPILASLALDEFTSIDFRWNFGVLLTLYVTFFAVMQLVRYFRKSSIDAERAGR